jgi:hypothetical protein
MTAAEFSSYGYFPERFRAAFPDESRRATQLLGGARVSMPTMDMIRNLQSTVQNAYNEDIRQWPLEKRPIRPSPFIANALSLCFAYGQFHVSGRQIYDIGRPMQEILAGADYRDVPVSMLMLPFPNIYIHFGSQSFSIKGSPFEGAWITEYQGRYQFYLCANPHQDFSRKTRFQRSARYLYLTFDTSGYPPDTGLGDVVDDAVRKEIETLQQSASKPADTWDYGSIEVMDRRGEGSKEDLENFRIGIRSLDDAMRLVVNAMIFITAYKEHVTTSWTPDTPVDLVKEIDGAAGQKTQKEARRKIIEGGYYRVNFVGESFGDNDYQGETEADEHGVIPHWRRSHWRRQHFGEGRKESRLVLIRKVLVNAHKLGPGEEPMGRISTV